MSDLLIDWDNPLSDHPSNDGLIERWQAFPGAMGFGTTLMRGLRHRYPGTLTNMSIPSTATSGWGEATTRPGGHGELRFVTNDYVAVPTFGAVLNGLPALTVTFCFKQNVLDQINYLFVAQGTGTRVRIYTYSDGAMYFEIGTGGGYGVISDYSLNVTAGQWTHFELVFDGSLAGNLNRLKCYINGLPVTIAFGGTVSATLGAWVGTEDLYLGGRAGVEALDGRMDDVRFYNRALSASEVYANYIDSQRLADPTLSWIQRRAYSFPAAGGAPWVYHHINRQNAGMVA